MCNLCGFSGTYFSEEISLFHLSEQSSSAVEGADKILHSISGVPGNLWLLNSRVDALENVFGGYSSTAATGSYCVCVVKAFVVSRKITVP